MFVNNVWLTLDTNDIEHGLRIIPMGNKNRLLWSSEVVAEQIAVIQTLLATRVPHVIDGYRYLVYFLQQIHQHPASRVHKLTPRQWQQRFSNNPLGSPLHQIRNARLR